MTLIYSQQRTLLRLFFTPKLGSVAQRKILEAFPSLEALEEWMDKKIPLHPPVDGIKNELFLRLQDSALQKRAEQELDALEKRQARLLSIFDDDYPPLLKQIYQPPLVLFTQGVLPDWKNRFPIAFVGTRQATDYGKKIIHYLIEGLARAPVIIVSGFARGVDTWAHQAALHFGLPTVGILGTGWDIIYPKENTKLFHQMCRTNGFISQSSMGTEASTWSFPERNRIISGVSQGVLVVEAPKKSGALLTAQYALEEGRDIWTVPGNIFSPKNEGCRALIQQGAKLVTAAHEILQDLSESFSVEVASSTPAATAAELHFELEEVEKKLLKILSVDPLHIDKITEISKLDPSLVAGNLMNLSLKGIIEELPGKFFVKA